MKREANRIIYGVQAGIRSLARQDYGATLAGVQDALDESSFRRLRARLLESEQGKVLLHEKPRFPFSVEWAQNLEKKPKGTLGFELIAFLKRNQLLKMVHIEDNPLGWDPELNYVKWRWRETHDIRHVLTGLETSIDQELILQAFQLGQAHNRFAWAQMIVGSPLVPKHWSRLIAAYRQAFWAGKRAHLLVAVPWETLWDRPLDELRVRFNVPVLE